MRAHSRPRNIIFVPMMDCLGGAARMMPVPHPRATLASPLRGCLVVLGTPDLGHIPTTAELGRCTFRSPFSAGDSTNGGCRHRWDE